jgi:hypothetical protein
MDRQDGRVLIVRATKKLLDRIGYGLITRAPIPPQHGSSADPCSAA